MRREALWFAAGVALGAVATLAAVGSNSPPTRPVVQASGRASQTPSTRTAAASLPVWPNFSLIGVWTAQGAPQYVSAAQNPVLLFAALQPETVVRALKAAGRRPLTLVATAFPTGSLSAAENRVASLESGTLAGRTVYLLQGSWRTYARSLPVLLYQDPHGSQTPVSLPWAKVTKAALKRAYADTMALVAQGAGLGG